MYCIFSLQLGREKRTLALSNSLIYFICCYCYNLRCSYSFIQSEKAIYLATEYVQPLESHLEIQGNRDLSISWGLFQVTVRIRIVKIISCLDSRLKPNVGISPSPPHRER
jgi:hypothetical protein